MRTIVLPGVLEPPSDCRLLAQVMRELRLARGAAALEIFAGSGVLAVNAALDGAREVTAVDISARAVLNAWLNGFLNRVRVRALRGDLFAPVAGERFDLIVANPPYLPGGSDELPAGGIERAWEGGRDGRRLLDRLCSEASGHLTQRGRLLLVQSSLSGERATLDRLAESGLSASVLARQRGPLGPIAAARVDLLRRRGLLDAGEDEEEIIVIGADRGSG